MQKESQTDRFSKCCFLPSNSICFDSKQKKIASLSSTGENQNIAKQTRENHWKNETTRHENGPLVGDRQRTCLTFSRRTADVRAHACVRARFVRDESMRTRGGTVAELASRGARRQSLFRAAGRACASVGRSCTVDRPCPYDNCQGKRQAERQKKTVGGRELLLCMLRCESSRGEKRKDWIVSERTIKDARRRRNARLSTYMATKISTVRASATTAKADDDDETETMFFYIQFAATVYTRTSDHLAKKHLRWR